MVYATCLRDSDRREVAGIHHDTQIPQSDPAYWLTWFASDDVALTAARAQELGATLLVPVSDTPFGRMVIVEAPQGDVFGVIAVAPAND